MALGRTAPGLKPHNFNVPLMNIRQAAGTAAGAALTVQGTYVGGGTINLVDIQDVNNSNGVNVRLGGNGVTTPSKTIRVNGGILQVVNDAYSATIMSLTDTGQFSAAGSITAGDYLFSPNIVYAGKTDGTMGYVRMDGGDLTHTGFISWYSANGNRQGYLGFGTTTAAGDTGTVNLVCGTLQLTGTLGVSSTATLQGLVVANAAGSTYGGQWQMNNTSVGATNNAKYFRISPTGALEIINSAFSAVIMSLSDGGTFAVSSSLNAPFVTISSVSGDISHFYSSDAANRYVVISNTNAAGGSGVLVESNNGANVMLMDMLTSGTARIGTTTNNNVQVLINGGVVATVSTGLFAVTGSVSSSVAPTTAWGLDLAGGANAVVIANNGTYDFSTGSGFHFFYDDSGGGAAYAFSVFGQTVVTNFSGTLFGNVSGHAGTMNFFYNGSTAYRLENKTGGSKTIYVTCIKARPSN